MNQKAFEIIEDILREELDNQGFGQAIKLDDEAGKAYMYVLEDIGYSILFDDSKKSFVLRSATLNDGKADKWKNLSSWLYDEETATKADLESIGNDFLDIVRGPRRLEVQKKVAKKTKGDDRNIDPLFFFNRMISYIPELREEMNKDRIKYAKIRYATLTKSLLVPACEKIAKENGSELVKMTELFDDMYKDGDVEVRGIVIHGLFNSLSDEAMANISAHFGDELKKVYKCSRPLKNKKVKPEKVKKKNQIIANAVENAKQLEKEKRANQK